MDKLLRVELESLLEEIEHKAAEARANDLANPDLDYCKGINRGLASGLLMARGWLSEILEDNQ
jgi:hypothetical protein